MMQLTVFKKGQIHAATTASVKHKNARLFNNSRVMMGFKVIKIALEKKNGTSTQTHTNTGIWAFGRKISSNTYILTLNTTNLHRY